MSDHIEWGHASLRPNLYTPDEVDEWNPDDGNEARDWAFAVGETAVLYGGLEQLEVWLTAAAEALAEPLRQHRNDKIKARRKSMGDGKCQHEWMLTEDGYSRSWGTKVDKKNRVITAYFDGTSDFSDDGTGVYLMCTTCAAEKPVPSDYEIEYS